MIPVKRRYGNKVKHREIEAYARREIKSGGHITHRCAVGQCQPQYFYKKSQGFRHIEKKAKDGLLYYLHSDAFEYCLQNVSAVEKTDEMIQYEKIHPENRIDFFDASVFACIRKLVEMGNRDKLKKWFKKQ